MSQFILPDGKAPRQSSFQNDTPKLAAIYARVSTEDQGKGFSLPSR